MRRSQSLRFLTMLTGLGMAGLLIGFVIGPRPGQPVPVPVSS
jgi:hypothetical protein